MQLLTSVDNEYVEFKGDVYLKLASGNVLLKVREDLYQWFGSDIAPKMGKDSLAKTAPSTFANVDVAKECLTQF